jgi:hypothetical protein
MSTSRRGFLKLLSAAIATPVIAKLSMDDSLALPAKVEAVEVIEPAIVRSGAASFARANRIYCMPGMVGQLSDHIRSSAMASLPGGTHFQIRAVPMSWEDRGRAGVRGNGKNGVALVWVSESDVTPYDSEYELVGRFMVPKREELIVPASSVAAGLTEGKSYAQVQADPQDKWVVLDDVKDPPPKPDFWERLLGIKR